ncbi:MAG: GH25 family lysozyme [Anaerolineaceae bacterium]|jgi:GH25 family lysozyme M1 (1,4-beta-N-acetylmuramidase)|nr:GH25 family lysozyme [Anaerolineaceae bacterium]MDD4043095.1 GH25 family lysozyme [Anaerolineaceae bacterium]MDD4576970.1 GH25 family lysozyme [Anaerolineaceae bacterium]
MDYFTRNQGYPFGIDLSQHNASWDGKTIPNFDQIRRHSPEVQFVALRAGVSWGYRDSQFARYFAEAQRVGLCILPYHVLYPSTDAVRQMDAFLAILKDVNLDELRLVLDVELAQNKSKAHITKVVSESLEYLKDVIGRYPLIYSRAMWVNEFLQVSDLPEVDWWLAQYIRSLDHPLYTPEYPCPPMLPRGVGKWLIHQTTQRGPALGGVGYYMDYNRWNGSAEQLRAYFSKHKNEPIPCPVDQLPCERAAKALSVQPQEEVVAA